MPTPCEDLTSSAKDATKHIQEDRKAITQAVLELNLELNKKRGSPDPDEVKKLIKNVEDALKTGDKCHKDSEKEFDRLENAWYKLNPGAKNFAGPMVTDDCTEAGKLIQVGNRTDLPDFAKLIKKTNEDLRPIRKKLP